MGGGHTKSVRFLTLAGADLDLCDTEDRSALHHVARRGHVETLEVLLKGCNDRSFSGADVDLRDLRGRTALAEASDAGHFAVVSILVDSDAALDSDLGGST